MGIGKSKETPEQIDAKINSFFGRMAKKPNYNWRELDEWKKKHDPNYDDFWMRAEELKGGDDNAAPRSTEPTRKVYSSQEMDNREWWKD
jgi:hypothetical protein